MREALATLADLDEADERWNKATEEKTRAEGFAEINQARLKTARENLQEAKNALDMRGIPEPGENAALPESKEACESAAQEEEKEADLLIQEAQRQKEIEGASQQRARECALQLESLERVQRQIHTIVSGHTALLTAASLAKQEQASATPVTEEPFFQVDEEQIDSVLQSLERMLDDLQGEKEQLDEEGKRCAQQITQALTGVRSQYKEVSLAQRFLEYAETSYAFHAQGFLCELTDRQRWIEEQRIQFQVHRDALQQQLLALAEAGCAFLTSAAKFSKLPAPLPAFEQRSFLRIQLNEPTTKEDRVEKISSLLNSIIDAPDKEIPTGLQLLQQAVKHLASPIKVQILFPVPDDLHYVAPSVLAKESGGERLTSMVLLYCTLISMRVAQRTKPSSKSYSLILDNPIGTASRMLFLQLQREVAQAMNIQLIYTTGLKDFDALHIFPNFTMGGSIACSFSRIRRRAETCATSSARRNLPTTGSFEIPFPPTNRR